MKKINFIAFLFLLISSVVFAQNQNPQAFAYQAIAKDATGQVLANQTIGIQINIRQTTTTGTIVYQETHTTTTTNSGFFSLYIGNGTATQGTFNTIDWGTGLYFMETAMDATGGTSYSSIGTSPVLTVPKAGYAYDGPDADATNELQVITKSGNTITLSNNGGSFSIDDADASITNETITNLSLVGTTLTITEAGQNYTLDLDALVNTSDTDATNELITSAQLNGTNLEITDAGGTKTVDLSSLSTGSSSTATVIQDADSDTKIQVEESADEDMIRFDIGGVEGLTLSKNTNGTTMIEFPNSLTNIFIGNDAGKDNTGNSNIFVGRQAGFKNTTANENTFIGTGAGRNNTTGDRNTFLGAYTGYNNITGVYNTFLGYGSGNSNISGNFNVFVGDGAGRSNTTGKSNTILGYSAGRNNTVGENNVYLGILAGYNSQGSSNVFLGYHAGYSETGNNKLYIENSNSTTPLIYGEFDNDLLRINGTLNINNAFSFPVADGANGQTLVTDGNGHLAWTTPSSTGTSTILQDTDGDTKIQVEESTDEDVIRFDIDGSERMVIQKNTSGYTMIDLMNSNYNTFIGTNAGLNTAPSQSYNGKKNSFIGYAAGYSNTTGFSNSFIGNEAGKNNTSGYSNAFLGDGAGRSNTTGSYNAFFGAFVGANNSSGSFNTFMGDGTGYFNTSGKHNTFIGASIARSNTTGGYNTFLGSYVGYLHTTGSYNTFMGREAGYNNQTGSSNVFIGHRAGYNETGSNKLYIENSNSTTPLIYGEFDNDLVRINGDIDVTGVATAPFWNSTSDRRLKEQFNNIKNPLAKLNQLNGYTYYWKDKTNDATLQVGVIAQEVEAVLPEIVHTDSKGIKSVDYSKLTALLIEVNKAQETKIATLEKHLTQVEQANKALKVQAIETATLSAQVKTLQQQINQILQLKTTASK